jgi:hypothetical protein
VKVVSQLVKAGSAVITDGQVTLEPEMNLAFGNTKLSQETQSWARSGYTQRTQVNVKRIYYTAGLRSDLLADVSFTDDFKAAAISLGNDTYDFQTAISFIHNWGNYGACSH